MRKTIREFKFKLSTEAVDNFVDHFQIRAFSGVINAVAVNSLKKYSFTPIRITDQ